MHFKLPVPVGNRSTTLDHLVRSPTVPKTTTRGAYFRGKVYECVCELYRKKCGHARYFESTQPILCSDKPLYIILGPERILGALGDLDPLDLRMIPWDDLLPDDEAIKKCFRRI